MNLTVSSANGKIYAIGGNVINGPVLSTVEEYDPVTDRWKKKNDMPNIRANGGISVVNGKIYIIGGATWNFGVPALPIVEEYDPIVDKWTRKTDIPTARLLCSSSAVGGKIYTIGGEDFVNGNSIIYSTVEEYTPEGWPFAVSSEGKLSSKWGAIKTAY